jgi:pimeloyl-ACP methyl ester carboxylesterase
MNDVTQPSGRRMMSVAGIDIEVHERGQGAPLLYLHGGGGIAADMPFVEALAKSYRVVAPSHPGFGASGLPEWMDSVDDVAHVQLEVMAKAGITDTFELVGMSFGGWVANEIATKIPERVKHLALIGPVGVKTGSRDKLDIPDVFATPNEKFMKLVYHQPDKWKPDMSAMTDDQIGVMVRNRESLALFAWEPYMHNPKLNHRLHRVTCPVLLLRGASDGVVTAEYLERYAKLFPKARIVTIPAAGHVPQVEQTAETAKTILEFLNG